MSCNTGKQLKLFCHLSLLIWVVNDLEGAIRYPLTTNKVIGTVYDVNSLLILTFSYLEIKSGIGSIQKGLNMFINRFDLVV